MSFSGFSEDDIRKLTKHQEANSKPQKALNKTSTKKVTFKSNTVSASRSKNILNNNAINSATTTVQAQELPEDAKLSITTKNSKKNDATNNKDSSHICESGEEADKLKEEAQQSIPDLENDKKYKDLDEFEARQKLIEEQNRKRKELLAKALADRTKQTQEEAQRLNEIQEEFKKLDAMLSTDVKILRKQIEIASIEYMESQKRYHKIEKEFLEAKLILHQKLEKKEMLTEHLCTIIEKNEERKAEKLTELLHKLEVKSEEQFKKIENATEISTSNVT